MSVRQVYLFELQTSLLKNFSLQDQNMQAKLSS